MVQRVQNRLKELIKKKKKEETAEILKKIEQKQLKDIQDKIIQEPDQDKKLQIWDNYILIKETEKEKLADLMGYGPEYKNSLVAILQNQKAKNQMAN